MFVAQAETRFRKGLESLAAGHARDALPFISAAIQFQQQTDVAGQGYATYLSYQGLCMCLTRSGMRQGLQRCRQASKMDPWNPDIWWNLGRVALMLRRRAEALRAFQKGLQLDSGHAGIQRDMHRMGIRRRPTLPFLSRENPCNMLLGRLRHLCGPRPAPSQRKSVEFDTPTWA
jgi:tetratricopeptide (TPR) repeat protein